jgi:hypothetical protein
MQNWKQATLRLNMSACLSACLTACVEQLGFKFAGFNEMKFEYF